MPSLHITPACIVTYYALRARSRVAPLLGFLGVWIIMKSVVARWHYLVDLPAGLLLAVLIIALTNRLCRFRLAPPEAAGSSPLQPEAPRVRLVAVEGTAPASPGA